jgi:hypothetical protein
MKEVIRIWTLLLLTLGCYTQNKSVCYVQKHEELTLVEPSVIYGGGSVSFDDKYFIDFTWHKTNYAIDTVIYKILKNKPIVVKPKNSVEIILKNEKSQITLNEDKDRFQKKTAISYSCQEIKDEYKK